MNLVLPGLSLKARQDLRINGVFYLFSHCAKGAQTWGKPLVIGAKVVPDERPGECNAQAQTRGGGLAAPTIGLTVSMARAIHTMAILSSDHLLRCLRRLESNSPIVRIWGDLDRGKEAADSFSGLVMKAATYFLAYHELGHLMLGHLTRSWQDLAQILRGSPLPTDPLDSEFLSVSEMDSFGNAGQPRARGEDALVRQALEVDADTHAIVWSVSALMREGAGQPPPDMTELERDVYHRFLSDRFACRFLAMLGAMLVLHIFAPQAVTQPRYLKVGSHPLPATRMATLVHIEPQVLGSLAEYGVDTLYDAQMFVASLFLSVERQVAENEGRSDGASQGEVAAMFRDRVIETGQVPMGMQPSEVGQHYQKLAGVRDVLAAHLMPWLDKADIQPWRA